MALDAASTPAYQQSYTMLMEKLNQLVELTIPPSQAKQPPPTEPITTNIPATNAPNTIELPAKPATDGSIPAYQQSYIKLMEKLDQLVESTIPLSPAKSLPPIKSITTDIPATNATNTIATENYAPTQIKEEELPQLIVKALTPETHLHTRVLPQVIRPVKISSILTPQDAPT